MVRRFKHAECESATATEMHLTKYGFQADLYDCDIATIGIAIIIANPYILTFALIPLLWIFTVKSKASSHLSPDYRSHRFKQSTTDSTIIRKETLQLK